jgi:FMN phosphatase YigB (HAD superfamily)
VDALRSNLNETLDLQLPLDFSLVQAFVDLFSTNEALWPILKDLQQNFSLGLLTNMYSGMLNRIRDANLLPNVEWDVIVDSSIVNMVKPNKDIYELAQSKANVLPSEILFIDNLQKNVDMASDLGWKTFLYDPSDHKKSCEDLLQLIKKSNVDL